MKRSDMVKEIKAMIRANSGWLEMWKEGEISYGKMAEELSKSILTHVEDCGMVPQYQVKVGVGRENSEGGEDYEVITINSWVEDTGEVCDE